MLQCVDDRVLKSIRHRGAIGAASIVKYHEPLQGKRYDMLIGELDILSEAVDALPKRRIQPLHGILPR
jgi:hypothetical protein